MEILSRNDAKKKGATSPFSARIYFDEMAEFFSYIAIDQQDNTYSSDSLEISNYLRLPRQLAEIAAIFLRRVFCTVHRRYEDRRV